MSPPPHFDCNLAISLANVCRQAYVQYLRNGEFTLPDGFQLVTRLSVTPLTGQSPTLFGFILQSPTQIIIAFRGSQTIWDWVSDMRVRQTPWPYGEGAGRVHNGFLDMYASCREQIFNALSTLPSTSQLYITGHSMGGAVAELCALDLAMNSPFTQPVMYNFGSPRTGNWQFASTYNKKVPQSMRIVVKKDMISKLPPVVVTSSPPWQFWLYTHVDTAVTLEAEGDSIKAHHDLGTYLKGLESLPNPNP